VKPTVYMEKRKEKKLGRRRRKEGKEKKKGKEKPLNDMSI